MRRYWLWILGAAALVLLSLSTTGALARAYEVILARSEIASLALYPSAQRAYAYGQEHFDSRQSVYAYDLGLANYFFTRARELDPELPYVNHELARIAFLRGQYDAALLLIDLQIEEHGDSEPSSYYVRGLIEGYMGNFAAAALDYKHFLQFDPHNWAALNDEAWVLLKAERYQEALQVSDSGLQTVPQNAWLLNSNATALFELGRYNDALAVIERASTAAAEVTPQEWEVAYPGNDPAIASEGLAALQKSIADNMHSIELAAASSTVQ